MGFLRYALALATAVTVDLALFHIGHDIMEIPSLVARLVSLALAIVYAVTINEWGSGRGFNRRRLRPTLMIASVLNFALFAIMLMRFPAMQPSAVLAISSMAGFGFAIIGYWRFFRRTG